MHTPVGPRTVELPTALQNARLDSPRLVVREDRVRENIRRLGVELQRLAPESGFRHLRPHAKTHKSAWVTHRLLESGIDRFKSTPHEVAMLLEAGARDVLVAYPPLPHRARALARLVALHPDRRISSQIGDSAHATALAEAAAAEGVRIDCLIDLDVGDHRTGLDPRRVDELAHAAICGLAADHLRIVGVHAYDGHNHSADRAARRTLAHEAMSRAVEALRSIRDRHPSARLVVAGGTPGFEGCLEALLELTRGDDLDVEVSPGTWIYWDTKYDGLLPGRFEFAAFVFCRVMDRTGPDLVTVDVGHKRWAIDQGPVECFSVPGLEVVKTSEEHTVLRHPESLRLPIGAPLLIVPRHVCPTVNLWEEFTLLREDGGLEILPVSARNR